MYKKNKMKFAFLEDKKKQLVLAQVESSTVNAA